MHTVQDANRNASGLHKSTSTYSAEESLTIHTASEQLQQSIWLNTSMSSITVIKDLNSIVISHQPSFLQCVSLQHPHVPWVTAEQNTLTSTPLTSRSSLKRTRALTCHCNWAGLSVGWFAALKSLPSFPFTTILSHLLMLAVMRRIESSCSQTRLNACKSDSLLLHSAWGVCGWAERCPCLSSLYK